MANTIIRHGPLSYIPLFPTSSFWRVILTISARFARLTKSFCSSGWHSWWLHTLRGWIMAMCTGSKRLAISSSSSNCRARKCVFRTRICPSLFNWTPSHLLDVICIMSNLIRRTQGSFQSMEVRHSNFAGFIDYLTGNTYVMVIMSDPTIRKLDLFSRLTSWVVCCRRVIINKSALFSSHRICCHTYEH